MKKLLAGLFIFGALTIAFQAHAFTLDDLMLQIQSLRAEIAQLRTSLKASALNPSITTTPTTDLTPRISYYSGKVNQHVDIASGTWQTDPDGSSGAGIDKLTYCKKFYPNTTSVADYKTETINSWHDAGNANNYSSTRLSYQCVINIITPPIITPINGGWSAWSDYGACVNGFKPQIRSCTNPAPANGGATCSGSIGQQVTCTVAPTPINGGWSVWVDSTSCINGYKNQTHTCTNPAPSNGGAYCVGDIGRTVSCTVAPTPINGGWSAWVDSASCINGYKNQTHTCTNPAPSNGGIACSGSTGQQVSCTVTPTLVNIYTSVGPNGTISPSGTTSIASGLTQKYTVTPNSGYTPTMTGCGGSLSGNVYTTATITNQCTVSATFKPILPIITPINGNWSAWSNSGSCVNEYQTQTRTCTNPAPANGGSNCAGLSTQQISCRNINNTSSCLSSGVCFDDRVLLITEGIDGSFIDSDNNLIDKQVTKYYSKNTQKEADFLVTFKDWDPLSSLSSAYSVYINRNDSGMGMFERIDDQYGSNGNLKSFIGMPNIKTLSFQNYPNDVSAFNSNVFAFVHEMGHHWLAYFSNPSLFISAQSALFHYDSCSIFKMGDSGDLMTNGHFNFQKTSDTTFSSPAPDNNPYTKKFSNLSLYVMGLIPDTEVSPFQIINDGTNNCPYSSGKFDGTTYNVTGSMKQITLPDLIKVYGERSPKFPNVQKDFTLKVALVVHKDSKLTQSDADTFKRYLDEVEKYLPFAFSNKATFKFIRNTSESVNTLSNNLCPKGCVTAKEFIDSLFKNDITLIADQNPEHYNGGFKENFTDNQWLKDQEMINKVVELTKGKINNLEKAKAIANWVKNSRIYKMPVSQPQTILEIFNSNEGVCYQAGYLTAAMMRLANIPARAISPDINAVEHEYTEFYDNGKWYGIDSTFKDSQDYEEATPRNISSLVSTLNTDNISFNNDILYKSDFGGIGLSDVVFTPSKIISANYIKADNPNKWGTLKFFKPMLKSSGGYINWVEIWSKNLDCDYYSCSQMIQTPGKAPRESKLNFPVFYRISFDGEIKIFQNGKFIKSEKVTKNMLGNDEGFITIPLPVGEYTLKYFKKDTNSQFDNMGKKQIAHTDFIVNTGENLFLENNIINDNLSNEEFVLFKKYLLDKYTGENSNKINTISNESNSSIFNAITRTLKLTFPRMTGDDVKILQTFLGITSDGVFGSGTMAKVAEWQLAHNIKADGVVGLETRGKMGL